VKLYRLAGHWAGVYSESVRKVFQTLHNFLNMFLIAASFRNARAFRVRFSKSLPSLLHLPRHATFGKLRSPFDDPSLGKDFKSFGFVGIFDDFSRQIWQFLALGALEDGTLIAAVDEQLFQNGIGSEQGLEEHNAAVAVPDVGGVDDGMRHKAKRVDEEMACLAFDLFACIIAARIDNGLSFLALLTLWLSIMQALGLAWRHLT
jgi:hypothetical protein